MLLTITIILVLLLLASGIEIGIAIGLTGVFLLLFQENIPFTVISREVMSSVNDYALLAIPFFILTGNLMMKGNLVERLLDFFGSFMRRITGGLGMGAMLASVFFASISGSSVASSAAMGKSVTTSLQKENYPKKFSAGIVAVGGTLGLMIPPSVTFILIGSMEGIPVSDLFIAGITPGILEGLILICTTYFVSKKQNLGIRKEIKFKEVSSSFRSSIAALVLPILIIGGIYLGFFTPTEVSVVAVVYSFLIGLLIYRTIKFKDLPGILGDTIYTTAMIFLVLIGGSILSFILTRFNIANLILDFINNLNIEQWQFLLLVNLILLIMGMFLDGISLIIILVPLLFPVATGMGVNPIHLAVIMTANVEIATITPPVGLNLFVISGITKLRVTDVAKGIVPFYGVRILGLMIITFVPFLSMWLL